MIISSGIKLIRSPFYISLIAIYPVLFLWNANYSQVSFIPILRTLGWSLAFSALLFIVLLGIFRKLHQAAIITGFIEIFFFSYGHAFNYLDSLTISGFIIGRHRYLLPLWSLLAVVCIFILLRKSIEGRVFALRMKIFSRLIALTLIQISLNASQFSNSKNNKTSPVKRASSNSAKNGGKPDVYYILVDGYSRTDILTDKFQVDNREFLSQLMEIGFTLPACTQSNYSNTSWSMSSMFNMDYLENLGIPDADLVKFQSGKNPLTNKLLKDNAVNRTFRSLGYQIVAFKTVFPFLNFPASDIYYDYDKTANAEDSLETSYFQALYLKTTVMRAGLENISANPELTRMIPLPILKALFPGTGIYETSNYRQYVQNKYMLDQLERIPEEVPGQKSVYAHVVVTHKPFTFTPTGDFLWPPDDTNEGYRKQVQYINSRLPDLLRSIIKKSTVPPVIIIQADHGFPEDATRPRILNAYYLPGARPGLVPDTITPVNSFRLVFDNYFSQNLPMMEDRSLFLDTSDGNGRIITIPSTCVPAQ